VCFKGEEIGMLDHRDISWADTVDPQACNSNPDDYKPLSRDPQRTPMQWDSSENGGFSSTTGSTWLPLHPDYMSNNLAEQKLRKGRTYSMYKQLVALRSTPAFWNGDFTYTTLNENVLAYTRSLEGVDTYTVVINFGSQTEQVDLCPLIPKCSARAARASITEILAKFTQFEVVVSGMQSKYHEG
jgi:alpha-glucosidase